MRHIGFDVDASVAFNGAEVHTARELGDQVRPHGDVTVNGKAWRSSTVRGDELALVDTSSERTLIVVGRAGLDEMTTLAQSLS